MDCDIYLEQADQIGTELLTRITTKEERDRIARAIILNPMCSDDIIKAVEIVGEMRSQGYSVEQAINRLLGNPE